MMIFVNLPFVADRQSEDHEVPIIDLTEKAMISNAIAPLAGAAGRQPFSMGTRTLTADWFFLDPQSEQEPRIPV